MSPEIRVLEQAEQNACVELMQAAFADDPLFVALFGERDSGAAEGLRRRFIKCMLRMNRIVDGRVRGVFADQQLVGAALVELPQISYGRHHWRMIRAGLAFLPFMLELGWRKAGTLNRYQQQTRAHAPVESPHHYLTMVAVSPRVQGKGLGRRLIDEIKAMADSDPRSVGVALDTENVDNVALYTRWGFQPGPSVELPGRTAHTMLYRSPGTLGSTSGVPA